MSCVYDVDEEQKKKILLGHSEELASKACSSNEKSRGLLIAPILVNLYLSFMKEKYF